MRACSFAFALLVAVPVLAQPPGVPVTAPGVVGTLLRHADFPSAHVAARNVDVWLPPGYDADTTRRHPVVYMHDGQNLFDPATSYIGVDWGVDEALTDLIAVGAVPPAIVVAVWNSPQRFHEYMPQRATEALPDSTRRRSERESGPLRSDAYLRFLADELKPFVDRTYRTRPERAATSVMGSSMGGLISLYALLERPDVFGAAAAVSTHWPAAPDVLLDYVRRRLPAPGTHRLYYDFGTETLDAQYEPFQRRADAFMRAAGYHEGRDWVTMKFPGAEHSERAWRTRVHLPLLFLLGRP